MDERIGAVQRMQDYIAEHLQGEITWAELAKASGFSPWHSYRLFRAYTGYSPADYIRRFRLSQSAMRLKREKITITEAAFSLGFGSVDGYTRAFFREFGCNPSDYAARPVPVTLFVPYGVKFRFMERRTMENVKSVFVQAVQKPARKVIVKRGQKAEEYWDYCTEVGCDVWGTLLSMDSLGGEPVCMWLPEKYRANGSAYVQGVEVPPDYNGSVPSGFDVILLPQAEYLLFCGEPFAEEDFEQAIGAVQQAMEKFVPQNIGYEWDDSSPRIQLEPKGSRGYMELRAVKKLR